MLKSVSFLIFALYLLGLVAPSDSLYFSKLKINIEHSHESTDHQHHHDLEEQSGAENLMDHAGESHDSKDSDQESSHHHHNILVLVSNVYISNTAAIAIVLEMSRVQEEYQKIKSDPLPKSLCLSSIFRPPIA